MASNSSNSAVSTAPCWPFNFTFLVRKLIERSTWLKQWPFLHYDVVLLYLCCTCAIASKQERLKSANAESTFVSELFLIHTSHGILHPHQNYVYCCYSSSKIT